MIPHRLRALTLNFWGRSAPLDRRLALAARQLTALAPDVIGLQEVQPHGDATTAHALAAALGHHVVYAPALRWDDGALGPGIAAGEEGLAIVSRWPIERSRALRLPEARPREARILLSARLATPAGPIWFHTTHLHYRLDDGVAREAQVVAIDDAIRACGRGNDDPPQILCGDFNATADADEIRFLRGLTTLAGRRTHFQDAWLRRHPEPQPGDGPERGITWSSDNEHTRPLRSLDLDRRIDYVFVTTRKKDGRGTVHACRVALTERDGDGADAICASDHYGVVADVQIAAG
ncbi:MAG TPA: endonuclease/exonuclease/phosphatase family protein [Kofleriaceae bacterium]|nr:endonuclease/exonuclease/phosphatase family protein [Kofleriaceae bacterium]